jgi:hypothetical protein
MKLVAKWLFFRTRHVGPLVDTRGPIVMSSAKKNAHFATRCVNSYSATHNTG